MGRDSNVERTETKENIMRLTHIANRLDSGVRDLEKVLEETQQRLGEHRHADDGGTERDPRGNTGP